MGGLLGRFRLRPRAPGCGHPGCGPGGCRFAGRFALDGIVDPRQGTIYEQKLHDSAARVAAIIVSGLVDELDGDVRTVLERFYDPKQGLTVFTDPAPRGSRTPTERLLKTPAGLRLERTGFVGSWQRGWGVHGPRGYLARVLVRTVSEPEAPVELALDGVVVVEILPVWMATPAVPDRPDQTRRAAVRADVSAQLWAALNERGGRVGQTA